MISPLRFGDAHLNDLHKGSVIVSRPWPTDEPGSRYALLITSDLKPLKLPDRVLGRKMQVLQRPSFSAIQYREQPDGSFKRQEELSIGKHVWFSSGGDPVNLNYDVAKVDKEAGNRIWLSV